MNKITKINIFILLMFVYVFSELMLIKKWINIYENPKMYNKIKGFQKYRKSFWYERQADYHRKLFSKNYVAPLLTLAPLLVIIYGGLYALATSIQKYLLVSSDAILYFRTGDFGIGFVGAIFLALTLAPYIIYNLKSPIFIASTMSAFNSKNRHGDWKKLIVSLTLSFTVFFPLYMLSIYCYGYANENEIVYNPYLGIDEIVYEYKEIKTIKTGYSSDKNATEFYLEYIITIDYIGSFNVFDAGSNVVDYVDKQLEKYDVNYEKAIVDHLTYKKMAEYCTPTQKIIIDKMFVIKESNLDKWYAPNRQVLFALSTG